MPLTTNAVPRVTAIIPTLCSAPRAEALKRAISSLKNASSNPVRILVVVNGQRFDPELLAELQSRQDINVAYIREGSAPLAQLEGRRRVKTEFFCFLDDDDEYLAGAIDRRIEVIARHPNASIVVTNGLIKDDQGLMESCFDKFSDAAADPLLALFIENWLSSCGGLFRTDKVSISMFEDYSDYIEWTWLAFKLSNSGHELCFIDEPTYQINRTPRSASMSEAYNDFHVILLDRMLKKTTRHDVRAIIRTRLGAAWHSSSYQYMNARKMSLAWNAHLESLKYPGGWRYIAYTRHLVLSALYRD